MIKSSWYSYLVYLAIAALFSPRCCLCIADEAAPDTSSTPATRPLTVFRGDTRPPREIRAAAGFLCREPPKRGNVGYSLRNHVVDWSAFQLGAGLEEFDSQFVSTSMDIRAARVYAEKSGYIYHIKTTQNAIDVNASFRAAGMKPPFNAEQEHAFLGGIGWSQVIGYQKVEEPHWTPNPDYNPVFESLRPGGAQPQFLDRDISGMRAAADKLMSSEENVKAKAAGAAPSYCSIESARLTRRQTCKPKFAYNGRTSRPEPAQPSNNQDGEPPRRPKEPDSGRKHSTHDYQDPPIHRQESLDIAVEGPPGRSVKSNSPQDEAHLVADDEGPPSRSASAPLSHHQQHVENKDEAPPIDRLLKPPRPEFKEDDSDFGDHGPPSRKPSPSHNQQPPGDDEGPPGRRYGKLSPHNQEQLRGGNRGVEGHVTKSLTSHVQPNYYRLGEGLPGRSHKTNTIILAGEGRVAW